VRLYFGRRQQQGGGRKAQKKGRQGEAGGSGLQQRRQLAAPQGKRRVKVRLAGLREEDLEEEDKEEGGEGGLLQGREGGAAGAAGEAGLSGLRRQAGEGTPGASPAATPRAAAAAPAAFGAPPPPRSPSLPASPQPSPGLYPPAALERGPPPKPQRVLAVDSEPVLVNRVRPLPSGSSWQPVAKSMRAPGNRPVLWGTDETGEYAPINDERPEVGRLGQAAGCCCVWGVGAAAAGRRMCQQLWVGAGAA
jgi:hypothetical protein